MNKDFKEKGLKTTPHRTEIISILKSAAEPLSAEEIYLGLAKGKSAVNLSTVYRALKALSEKNLITKIKLAGKNQALYEIRKISHCHYLICLGCNKVTSVSGCPVKAYENSLAGQTGYSIAGHALEIYGYCPDCLNKS